MGKLIAYDPLHRVTSIQVSVFAGDDAGINWNLVEVTPALPAAAMEAFLRDVVAPLQVSIEAMQ